jgi:hypothetical protein
MMAFDEAKFRSAAKAAGYSDEEINAELKGSAPAAPAGAAPAPAMDDTFAESSRKLREEYDKKVKQATTTEFNIGDQTFSIPTFFTSPAGIVTAASAGIGLASTLYGAGTIAPKVYQSIKDRFISKVPEIDRTIDIPLEARPSPTPNVSPTPLQQTNLTPQEVQNRADRLKAAQPVAPVAPTAAPVDMAAPVASPMAPVAPEAPVATPFSAAPAGAAAPTPSAQPGSSATSVVVDTVKELMDEVPTQVPAAVQPPAAAPQPVAPPKELLTGTGKPAFAGQGPEAALNKKGEPKFKPDYPGIEQVPRGFAFVPNAQYIDTPRQNIGLQEYLKAYTERPFPLTNELAIEQSKEINKMLGRATRAEAKAAGLPPAEITPGITKKTSAGTKPVRVAGTLGALIAIPDLAKAETSGQRAMAKANLLEAILPPGFMMSGAGEGSTLSPEQLRYQQNAMLLGSPYAQSPQAVKLRQEQEYIRKVGAGRGIAPPSAYQR